MTHFHLKKTQDKPSGSMPAARLRKILILVALFAVPFFGLIQLFFGPTLVFGDNPLVKLDGIPPNVLYSWGAENFGTTVRQGLFAARNTVLLVFSSSEHAFFILNVALPILLIVPFYYLFLTKIGIKNTWVKLIAALFALVNPIVFGDFSKAQSFWVYLPLPWVLYFVLRIFYFLDLRWKNFVLLGLCLFLTFGLLPPIILPMLGIYSLVVIAVVIYQAHLGLVKKILNWRMLIGLALTLGVFILTALPFAVVVSAGQEAYTPSSLLGDYYHNYSSTSLVNTLRLAGNNGNGLSILKFNEFSFTNIFGYVAIVVIILGMITVKRRSELSGLLPVLLVPLLAMLALLQVFAVDPNTGAKIFQSQFLVSTIRDPTKIFEVLLVLVVLAFALGLLVLWNTRGIRGRYFIGAVVTASILIYGWPIFTGNLGILVNRNETIEDYKPDGEIAQVVQNEEKNTGRAIIVPSGHNDELNYQSVSSSLNALRLGGGLPYTTRMVAALQDALTGNSPYFKRLLDIAGINHVYLKGDADEYTNKAFGLISAPQGLEITKAFVEKELGAGLSVGPFSMFKNNSALPSVYSPDKAVNIVGTRDIHQMLPLIGNGATVLSNMKVGAKDIYDSYKASSTITGSGLTGRAQLFNPNLMELRYLAQPLKNGTAQLVIETVNPATDIRQTIVSQSIKGDASTLVIDGNMYPLTSDEAKVSVRAGEHEISYGTQTVLNISTLDPSFEASQPIGDASKGRAGAPEIKSEVSKDATDQKSSALISTKNHLALISKRVQVPEEVSAYKVQFQYKKEVGLNPSFGFYQGNTLLNNSQTELSGDTGKWNEQTSFLALNTDKKYFDFNFYQDATDDKMSQSKIDNLRVYKINVMPLQTLNIMPYEPDYDISAVSSRQATKTLSVNYIKNGSFEDKSLWGYVGDSTKTAAGEAKFEASQSSDSTEGGHSLELKSKNHTAYVSRGLTAFDANKPYKLKFSYRHVKGSQPAVAIWQSGLNKPVSYTTLNSTGAWKDYEYVFIPDTGATNIVVYLYSPSAGTETVNLFDNVQITEQPLIENYLIQTANAQTPTSPLIIKSARKSPVYVSNTIRKQNGIVVFNESYHQGWRAFILPKESSQNVLSYLGGKKPGYEIPASNHVVANGYANAWVIDPSLFPADGGNEYELILEYWPQRQFYVGLVISGLTLAGVLGYLGYAGVRRYKRRRPGSGGGDDGPEPPTGGGAPETPRADAPRPVTGEARRPNAPRAGTVRRRPAPAAKKERLLRF